MNKLYLHVGLYKTGTSFLQAEIFPHLKGINFIQLKGKDQEYFKQLYQDNKLDYELIRSTMKKYISSGKNLISDEDLSGDPFVERKRRRDIFRDVKKIFNFLDISIILGIREQSDFIVSLYKQYLHVGGVESFSGFLESMNSKVNFLDRLLFSEYIKDIKSAFGNVPIHIYTFEDIKNDKDHLVKTMIEFMGESYVPRFNPDKVYNRGYGGIQIELALILNKLFKSELNPSGILPNIKIPRVGTLPRMLLQNRLTQKLIYTRYQPPKDKIKQIKERYRGDNHKLGSELNLNLSQNYFE